MKVLSIKEPWAWAICNLPRGFRKDIENRNWNTKYRGEFLVHASKGFDALGYERMKWYLKELKYDGYIPKKEEFVYGAIIGKTELVDVTQKPRSRWWEGPYGFKLANTKALLTPVPHKGALKFFKIDNPSIEKELKLIDACGFEYGLKGHKYIKVTVSQMINSLNGLGICDSCCKAMSTGYLIPVLNSCYCVDCFKKWENGAEFYSEDAGYENLKTEIFLKALAHKSE